MKNIALITLFALSLLITACGKEDSAEVTPSTTPAATAKAVEASGDVSGCGSSTKDGSGSKAGSQCKCKKPAATTAAAPTDVAPAK